MLSKREKFMQSLTLPLAMLIFVALFAVDFFMVPLADSSSTQIKAVVQPAEDISISKDFSPRIDEEAASIVREEKAVECPTLPGELWILILAAYVFLMFFNLFYDFEKSKNIHWFWEGLYTFLALWGWYIWDECHRNLWFPLYLMKLGIIVYLVYLHLFYKKKEIQLLAEEDLKNFEG